MKPQVYIAGALTNAIDLAQSRQLYERLGDYFEKKGWNAYLPHKKTDPALHPDLSAYEVKSNNEKQIALSSLMIAEVTDPSHGVGCEVDFAEGIGIPVIFLDRSTKPRVSRQMRGRWNIKTEIQYSPDNLAALFRQLDEVVDMLSNPVHLLLERAEGLQRDLVMMRYIAVWSANFIVDCVILALTRKHTAQPPPSL